MTDYVAAMQPGTNWGNTLDAVPDETSWGAPTTTQPMIRGLAAKGYKSLRLPVTWQNHMGPAPDYKIDPAWMDRVQQIVDWSLDANLYVMLNIHHDGWVGDLGHDHDAVLDRFQKVWLQIATRFKNYPNKLSFESKNEPGFQDENGHDLSDDQMRTLMDEVNTAFFNVVRGTGGGNATRPLVLPPVYTSSDQPMLDSLKATMAHLNDPNLIATVHYYGYYPFSVNMGGETKFGELEKHWVDTPFTAVHDTFVASGIPVIVGEWGVLSGDNIESGEMLKYHEYVAQYARTKGLTMMLWDTGGVYNRTTQDWQPANRDLAEIIRQAETGRATTSERDLLFLKPGASSQDTIINLNLNGNTLVSVQDGATTLKYGTDYIYSDNHLTIKSKILSKYFAGAYEEKTTLAINSNSGPAWRIHVRYAASPIVSAFKVVSGADLLIPTAFNGDVLATIESKYADGTNAGPVGWSAFPFWGSDFHPDYANHAIILSKSFFSGAPSGSIVNLAFYFWSGKVLTYQIQIKPPVSTGGPDYVIYDDTLAYGWYNWGWMSYDFGGTEQVHSGSAAISITPSPYGGLAMPTWATPDMTSYRTLTFWTHGGTVGGQYIGVGPILSDGSWGTGLAIPSPVANTWQKVEIPLSSLGVEGSSNVNGFYLQHWKGEDETKFYVDDIHLSTAYASTAIEITGTANVPTPLTITRSGYTLNRRTNRVVQTVTVSNPTTAAVTGPIYFVTDSLSNNTTLVNATGTTSQLVPTGSPYVLVSSGDLASKASVSLSLEFSVPTSGGITYDARTLSNGLVP